MKPYRLKVVDLTAAIASQPWELVWLGRLLCMGGVSLSLFCSFIAPTHASNAQTAAPSTIQYNPPTPPDLGTPMGRRRGGSSRGACSEYRSMQALMPTLDNPRAWGLTASDHPTFWFYLPERPSADIPLEFVLQSADDQYVYKTLFKPSDPAAGIISVKVPSESPALKLGQQYSWTLSLNCHPNSSAVAFIRGMVRRSPINLSLLPTLAKENTATAAVIYAEQGFWYDAVTLLAQAHRDQPLDPSLTHLWQDLLRQSGLAELQTVALHPCCEAKPQIIQLGQSVDH